jgi:hypothetical protein
MTAAADQDAGVGESAARVLARQVRKAARLGWARPAFGLYLLAVATLPLKWGSPLAGAYERAGWADVLVAAATVAWVWEHRHAGVRRRRRPQAWQLALAAYVLISLLSAAVVAPGSTTSWETVLLMVELAFLAVLTADFGRDADLRAALAVVVVVMSLVTVALALVGLLLFYVGVHTSLIGPYGEQLTASSRYARVTAGFYSPPLLAGYCIFASAIVARTDTRLPRRLLLTTQIALGLICALTVSRALLGYLTAIALRHFLPRPTRKAQAAALAAVVVSVGTIAALTVGRLHLDPTRPASITYSVPDPGNRRETFIASLHTFEHHPLLGSGPGSLPGVNAGQPFRAHMTPLNVAATLGAPALALLVTMFVLLWRGRRRPTDLATWTGLAGVAIDGLAGDVDHYRHIWILIGLAGA